MELLYPTRPPSPTEAVDNASEHGSNAGSTHSSTVHIKLPPTPLRYLHLVVIIVNG
jgi:hypothetical protein